jgi:hypothetical protein
MQLKTDDKLDPFILPLDATRQIVQPQEHSVVPRKERKNKKSKQEQYGITGCKEREIEDDVQESVSG